jgi:hypothetical protein
MRARPDHDPGAVPGAKGGYVLVRDAVKRARPADAAVSRSAGRLSGQGT